MNADTQTPSLANFIDSRCLEYAHALVSDVDINFGVLLVDIKESLVIGTVTPDQWLMAAMWLSRRSRVEQCWDSKRRLHG